MMKELTVAMVPDPSSHCNTSVEDESSEKGLTHGTTPESTAKSILYVAAVAETVVTFEQS